MTNVESFKNGLWIHSPAILSVSPDVCFYRSAAGRYAFGDSTSPATYVEANRGLEIAVGVALPAFSAAAAGLTVNMRTQSAGGVGPSAGGDLILLTGSGAGAAGRRGYFNVTGSSAGLRTTMLGENSGSFSTGADCTFLGYNAGAAALVAANNTFVGSGAGAAATGTDNTAVGYNTGIAAALNQNTALGSSLTVAGGSANVNVGWNTAVTGAGNVSVGSSSLVTGSSNVGVGNSVNLGGASNSTAVGVSTSAGSGSIALGYGASAGVGVAVMGSNGFPISILYGGKGETNAAATAWAVSGTGGTTGGGGNSAGSDLELRGGPGTGTGVGGHVLIRNSPYGAAGIAVNPPATHLDFNQYGLAAHTPSAALTLAADVAAAVPPEWTLTAAAHGAAPGPGILAATERMDVYYNLSRTVTWASGNIALQRAFRITAPTYAIVAGVSQTIATAATFYVDNAPQAAGGGTAITQSYGIYQAAGNSYFGGALNLNSAPGAAVSPAGEGRIRYNNGTSAFEVSINNNPYVALATGAMPAPGGADSEIQYNNGGAFGGSPALTYDDTGGNLWLTFNTGLRTKASADPGAWTAAADTSGTTVYARTQSGGAHTLNNPSGANLILVTGAKGAGGTGRAGYFNVTNAAAGARTTYIGENAGTLCTSGDCVCVGYSAGAKLLSASNNTAVGSGALAQNEYGTENTAIGQGAGAAVTASLCVFVGQAAGGGVTGGVGSTIVGAGSAGTLITGSRNVIAGYLADAAATTTEYGVAVGASSKCATSCVAIGAAATTTVLASIVIGRAASTSTANTMVCGSDSYPINTFYGGKGEKAQFPTTFAISGTAPRDGTDTDTAGGELSLAPGRGTGDGLRGTLNLLFSRVVGTGTGVQTNETCLAIRGLTVPVAFTPVTATNSGATVYICTQKGGGTGETAGGNLIMQMGAVGAAAVASRRGYFNVTGDGAGVRTLMIGEDAGNLSTGADNTFMGYRAGYTVTVETGNTFVGSSAGALFAQYRGTMVGWSAGSLATGANSTFIGSEAGKNTTGTNNTFVGDRAGLSNIAGAGCVYVGQSAGYGALGTTSVMVGKNSGENGGATYTANNVVYVGEQAGRYATATGNVFVGQAAGLGQSANLITGTNNVAVGLSAMECAVATAHTFADCVAIGYRAGYVMTTGLNNVFVGSGAGVACTTASYNVAVGKGALAAMTTSGAHTAVGESAGTLYTGNTGLTAVGAGALKRATTGGSDAHGNNSLENCSTGVGNAAFGNSSLQNITTENNNTVVGVEAGLEYRASGSTYIGAAAGRGQGGGPLTGANNVGVGYLAMNCPGGAGAKTFTQCVAVGVSAGALLTTGSSNVLIGYQAGDALTIGGDNVAVGTNALGTQSTGSSNVAIGTQALSTSSTGAQNVAVGMSAGLAATGASGVFIGYAAGLSTTGASNTVIGATVGAFLTSGTNNVLIGAGANVPIAGTATGGVAIGYTAVADSSSVAIGYTATTSGAIDSIALGRGAATVTANTMVCGSASYPISVLYAGRGAVDGTPAAWAVSGTGGSGADVAGGNLEIRGGQGTGTGTGGSVQIRTAPMGATGSGLNTIGTRLELSQYGLATHTPAAALTLAGSVSGAVSPEWTLTAAAHGASPGPGILASTERYDVNYNLNRTVRWATGGITTQRAFVIQAPTYAFVGASSIDFAATLYVSGAPITGTNATLSNSYGLWVDSGQVRFDGGLLHPYDVRPYTDAASPVTVTDYISNAVFTNEGATAQVIFNLPAAAAGLTYTYIVQAAYNLRVLAAAGDTVRLAASVSAAAGYCEAATVGNVVKLVAINATEWIAVSIVGSWTVT